MEKENIFYGGEGKGGKCLEKENICFAQEKKNREENGGKYHGERKIVASGRTGMEGPIRGPHGPENIKETFLKYVTL